MKTLNIVLFGIGNVGSTLIKQILAGKEHFNDLGLDIKIPIIANSKLVFFDKKGISHSWESDFDSFGIPYTIEEIINYVQDQELENVVAVDATASEKFVENYELLVEEGFDIVAANKVANTLSQEFYESFRGTLRKHNKNFLYETNVGAGLPIVQTLQDLHKAGEKITKVRGVFSGSLSYIFNKFSEGDISFSEVVQEAQEKGFTEPDPRIDLSGKDVGRKLLILARELGVKKELEEVQIENLVPEQLNGQTSLKHFFKNVHVIDAELGELKGELRPDEVLRHIGELDLTTEELKVNLVKVKKNSALGTLKNTDAAFEIYAESYGEYPILIQGAGAGAAVTARGVLSDLIKLAENLRYEDPIKEAEQRLSF